MALTGSVSRWFNRKGYGFIHVLTSDSEHTGNDLFVHLSGINVSNDGYKSLYAGEYVSFDFDKGNDGRYTCVNVTGVLGGPLLVEHSEYRYKYFQRNSMSDARRAARAAENIEKITSEETVDDDDDDDVPDLDVDENDPEQ